MSVIVNANILKCKKCGALVRAEKFSKHTSRAHPPDFQPMPLLGNPLFDSESPILTALITVPEREIEMRLRDLLASQYDSEGTKLYNMGISFLRVGEPEQAASCFEDSLKLNPNNNEASKCLDLARKSIRILRGNEKFQMSDLDWMGTLASIAKNSDMFEIAIGIEEKMVEIDIAGGGALNDLGITYRKMGNNEKAVECFDRALQIQPDMPEALSGKALCLMSAGKLDEASALYQKALQAKPDIIQGWYNLGVISMWKDDYERAIELLDKAIALNDEYYMAWHAKSRALKVLNRNAEAQNCLKMARRLNPEFVRAALSSERALTHTSNIQARKKQSPAMKARRFDG